MRGPRAWAALAVVVVVTGACTSDEPGADAPSATTTTRPAEPLDPTRRAELASLVAEAGACDHFDAAHCLLPFPSDHFSAPDPSTASGRRVQFPGDILADASGVPLDVTEWNRDDGFSPGTPIMVAVGDVDVTASGLPPLEDIGASLEPGSASVVVDMATGERLAHWAELDAGGSGILLVRPAVNLPEGHRIAVGLSGLVDLEGDSLAPRLPFVVHRDALTTDLDTVEARREPMEEVFGALGDAGVDRDGLWLAWDFTVASAGSTTGRLVAMRDATFEQLGDGAPAFAVEEVVSDPAELDEGIARVVRGTFEVPSFLTGDGGPGSRLHYSEADPGPGALPTPSGSSLTASFTCQVPRAALDGGGRTSRPVVYGHGLLGGRREVESSHVARVASTNDMTYCATDWIGMSTEDIPQVITILGDLSSFPTLADRTQQGILHAVVLGRLLVASDGLASDPAFQVEGVPVLDTTAAYFDGNSQGAIIGGAATAIAPDWDRATLGVAGMNYSTLLTRSTDFDRYFVILRDAYPDRVDQMVLYGVIQMLWDRAETNGYAAHLGDDPLPGTSPRRVLLHVAFGDHQVANVSAEVEARTIGARLRTPALAEGRHPLGGVWGTEAMPTDGWDGNALVYFDSGTLPPPTANITPTDSAEWQSVCGGLDEEQVDDDPRCADSHEDPRRDPQSIAQKDAFFRPDGVIVDPCPGEPCTAVPRSRLEG